MFLATLNPASLVPKTHYLLMRLKNREKIFPCGAKLARQGAFKDYHDPKGPSEAPNPFILPRAPRSHAYRVRLAPNIYALFSS